MQICQQSSFFYLTLVKHRKGHQVFSEAIKWTNNFSRIFRNGLYTWVLLVVWSEIEPKKRSKHLISLRVDTFLYDSVPMPELLITLITPPWIWSKFNHEWFCINSHNSFSFVLHVYKFKIQFMFELLAKESLLTIKIFLSFLISIYQFIFYCEPLVKMLKYTEKYFWLLKGTCALLIPFYVHINTSS